MTPARVSRARQPRRAGEPGAAEGPGPPSAEWSTRWLRHDREEVHHVGDSGRRPGRTLGLLTLRPRAHAAAKRHLTTGDIHGDAAGVHLGAALERLLDLHLDVGRDHARLDHDLVADPLHAHEVPHGALGGSFLVLPLDLALERDPPLANSHLAHVVGHGLVVLESPD